MTIDHECEDYARECVRLAGLAENSELREQLIDMARECMAAAMHEEPPAQGASDASATPYQILIRTRLGTRKRAAISRRASRN